MNKVSTCDAWIKACLAVKFLGQIHTNELRRYVGEGSQPSGNVKLLLGKARGSPRNIARIDEGGTERSATHSNGPSPLTPTRS